MNKYPESFKTVRFQDCDPMSHLNNGRYLDYFMNAREDQLLEFYGINVYERLRKGGQSWVVAKSEIIYKRPAWLMEKVLIKSQVNNYSLTHIEVEMAMYDEKGLQLKSILRSVFIPFNVKTNQVEAHDEEILDLLKNVRVENVEPSLEVRVEQLAGQKVH